jgi:hypothetical protein
MMTPPALVVIHTSIIPTVLGHVPVIMNIITIITIAMIISRTTVQKVNVAKPDPLVPVVQKGILGISVLPVQKGMPGISVPPVQKGILGISVLPVQKGISGISD